MSNTRRAIAIVFCIPLLLIAGCSRSESDDSPSDESAESAGSTGVVEAGAVAPAEPNTTDPAVPLRLTDQGRARADKPVFAPADPRDTAFEGMRFSAVPFHAQDTILGPLGLATGAGARDRAVLAVCEDLFSALLDGEIPLDMVSTTMGPGGRAVLDDLIWAADFLFEIRLGVVAPMTDIEASIPFRLMGDSRYALGEVILEKRGDQWYTADIQVEFFDRDTTSRFDPGLVRSERTL